MTLAKKIYTPDKPSPIKVAFFSNGPNLPTGYAKVIREITDRLSLDSDFEVAIINENFFSSEVKDWHGMPMFGVELPVVNGQPDRGQMFRGVAKTLERIKPHVVVFLEDSFTLHNYGFENIVKTQFARIFYIPLDGDWIPETGVKVIRGMDKLVAMSEFTQWALKKEGFDSEVIWHGVDLELFKPVTKEEQAALKVKYGFKPDDVVLYNYGRNSNIRKNNQGMMKALCEYLKDAPENHYAFLHILEPEFPGNSLFDYRDRHLNIEYGKEIPNRLRFSGFSMDKPATDQQVAEMMQMADVIVTASTGEGFGLIMSEGLSCAKPIISTDYTTPHELLMDESKGVGPRGWTVPISHAFVAGLNTEHAYVDTEKFAATIKEVISNPELMEERGVNGRLFAEKYLNWDYLVEKWKKTLKDSV